MNVALIYFKYPLYDGGSYIQEFVDELCLKSNTVSLFCCNFPNKNFNKPNNLKIYWLYLLEIPLIGDFIFNLQLLITGFFVFFYNQILNPKQTTKIDVINIINARGALAGFLLSKLFRIPAIITIEIINTPNGSITQKVFYQMQKFLYKLNFDHIICWSNYYQQYLIDWGIDKNKIKIIPSGIDTKRYDPTTVKVNDIKAKYSQNNPLIVFAKPLYYYNRISAELLIDAIFLLKDQIKINLLLGLGDQKSIIDKKIDQLKLTDQVKYMPVVPITKIPEYIMASDIIVLSYKYAPTISRSLLESMAMQKPIITTNIGAIPQILQNDVNALIVEPDPKQIAKAIYTLLQNPQKAHALGTKARSVVLSTYDISLIVNSTIKLYREHYK